MHTTSRPRGRVRTRLRRLLSFALGSGAGLAADLLTFSALVLVGVPPIVANLVSTAVATTIVYLLVTRYTFSAVRRARTYLLFFGWYAALSVVVSVLIEALSHGDRGWALALKLLSVPCTFTANYLFSTFLLSPSIRVATAEPAAGELDQASIGAAPQPRISEGTFS